MVKIYTTYDFILVLSKQIIRENILVYFTGDPIIGYSDIIKHSCASQTKAYRRVLRLIHI